MLKLSFHQTKAELMVRAAATLLFESLCKSGFQVVHLSEVIEPPQYGFTASADSAEIGPKFVRITDLQDGVINWKTVPYCKCDGAEKYQLGAGDILFARTGATTGKTHLVKDTPTAVFASYLIRVRPRPMVSCAYLYAFLQSGSYWSQILDQKEGSAQANVNGKKLADMCLPIADIATQNAVSRFIDVVRLRQDGGTDEFPELPPPMAEQRRIVARIEAMAGRIEEAKGLREEAVQATDAFPKAAARRLIGESPSPTWIQLRRYVEEIENGWSPACESRPASDGEWGVLKVGAVSFGRFDPKQNKALPLALSPIPQYEIRSGDFFCTFRDYLNSYLSSLL